jgi:hypothetical protein
VTPMIDIWLYVQSCRMPQKPANYPEANRSDRDVPALGYPLGTRFVLAVARLCRHGHSRTVPSREPVGPAGLPW